MFHLTDHNALLLEINLGIPTNRKKSFGETYWKPNSSILGDKNYDANWKVEEERLEKLRSKFEDDVDWLSSEGRGGTELKGNDRDKEPSGVLVPAAGL